MRTEIDHGRGLWRNYGTDVPRLVEDRLPITRPRREPSRARWTGRQIAWRVIAGKSEPGHPRGLLRAWALAELVSKRLWPTLEVPDAPYGLARLRFVPHSGEKLVLPDGVTVREGAMVGEFHCDNTVLLNLMKIGANPFAACREEFQSLARWIEHGGFADKVVAFRASTILAKGALRLGFTIFDTSLTIRRRLDRIFFTGLLLLYSPQGPRRVHYGSILKTYPKDAWISRNELIRLYGSAAESRPRRMSRFSAEPAGIPSTN